MNDQEGVSKVKQNRTICHSEACRLRSRHQGRVGGRGADATLNLNT